MIQINHDLPAFIAQKRGGGCAEQTTERKHDEATQGDGGQGQERPEPERV